MQIQKRESFKGDGLIRGVWVPPATYTFFCVPVLGVCNSPQEELKSRARMGNGSTGANLAVAGAAGGWRGGGAPPIPHPTRLAAAGSHFFINPKR